MTKFFDKHQLLVQNQYGFRKKLSTEQAVTEVYNKLLLNFERKKHTCAIFLDLKKAFDSVSHEILIKKLENLGVRGVALSLLKSYLTGRQHYVKTQTAESDLRILNFGVPQGSVLGPLLFLVFINDLPNCTNFNVTLFADDTFLSMESDNLTQLQNSANKELKKVYDWLIANKLTLNVLKSKFMLLSNKRNVNKDNFKLALKNKKSFERCSSYKYLGVYFDDKLDWKTHVKYVCEKIGKTCGFLSKLRYCANISLLKTVYHAMVQSHLQYCNVAWGDASQANIQPLIAMQNRVIRILNFAPFLSHNIQQYYENLGVMNLKQLHDFEKGKFMYKLINRQLPSNFDNLISANLSNVRQNMRSTENENIRVSVSRTNHGAKLLSCSGALLWNNIPLDLRKSETFNNFAKNFKKTFIP